MGTAAILVHFPEMSLPTYIAVNSSEGLLQTYTGILAFYNCIEMIGPIRFLIANDSKRYWSHKFCINLFHIFFRFVLMKLPAARDIECFTYRMRFARR